MINVSLKQLRYFDSLARLRHFRRAAEACAVSQPALSVQIKELEAEAGAPLIERNMRPIGLTPLGDQVAQHAERVLTQMAALEDTLRAAAVGVQGTMRLGVIPTVAPYLLPRMMAALGQTFPDLNVHIRETLTARLLAELGQGRLDAALVALPVSEPGLVETPLFDEALVLARPISQAHEPTPSPEALRELPLLLLEDGHCFRDQALAFCEILGNTNRDGLEASALSTLVQMVGAGRGVTLLPQMAVAVEQQAAPISIAQFPVPAPKRTLGMVWRKGTALADDLNKIADVLRRCDEDGATRKTL